MTNGLRPPWLRSRRLLLAVLAPLALVLGIAAWLLLGLGTRDEATCAPWDCPSSVPRRQSAAVALVYDVSGSMPRGLEKVFAAGLADANDAVVTLVCGGQVAADRWNFEGAAPGLADLDRTVVVLRIGAPKHEPPYFPDRTILGRVEPEQCPRIAETLPTRGFNHPLSYIELGKAEAADALRAIEADRRFLVIVSDFVEGQAMAPNPKWDEAVNRFLTSHTQVTTFSAHWRPNGHLKLRVVELQVR